MRVGKLLVLYCVTGLIVWSCDKQPAETPKPLETTAPVEASEPVATTGPPETLEPVKTPETQEKPREPASKVATEIVMDPNKTVTLQFLGHASFKISHRDVNIYIDPRNLEESPHDATVVLVSHSHRDHCSLPDIAKVSSIRTKLITTDEVVKEAQKGQVIKPGETYERPGFKIVGVPAYNLDKEFHPQDKLWLGFIIEMGGRRIYYAGDTDVIDEMKSLGRIDVALLPVGGTYTMDAVEAAQAAEIIKPRLAVPYHFGDIVGSLEDAVQFSQNAECMVRVMERKEKIFLEAF